MTGILLALILLATPVMAGKLTCNQLNKNIDQAALRLTKIRSEIAVEKDALRMKALQDHLRMDTKLYRKAMLEYQQRKCR